MLPVHDVLLQEAGEKHNSADDDADDALRRRLRVVDRVVPNGQHGDADEDGHEADESDADPRQTVLGQLAGAHGLERRLASRAASMGEWNSNNNNNMTTFSAH